MIRAIELLRVGFDLDGVLAHTEIPTLCDTATKPGWTCSSKTTWIQPGNYLPHCGCCCYTTGPTTGRPGLFTPNAGTSCGSIVSPTCWSSSVSDRDAGGLRAPLFAMRKHLPLQEETLPGLTKPFLPKDERPKRPKREARSLAGLTAFFLRCFPEQGPYNYAQTRWALNKAMEKHGLTIEEMFIRINRLAGKHPTLSPWEVAIIELPDRKRRPDKDAPQDVTDRRTDTSDVSQGTREKVLKILRRNDAEWEEEQL